MEDIDILYIQCVKVQENVKTAHLKNTAVKLENDTLLNICSFDMLRSSKAISFYLEELKSDCLPVVPHIW